ncbi:hypothetical protein DPMN_036520 [Dreissena polymorpha]|uniref:Uncharacterized protein n=1 Tax=Dreissena polymorpha TaxID=45954 RepID=A0A9D4MB13_DREPO|nr:hypothetical protein DPMN_036520 [Dreissena polymorpha]
MTQFRTRLRYQWDNLLTKNVASRVFTRKTAPPTGGHVFQRTGSTFELNQHIIKTNILTNFELYRDIIGTHLLTKFHEDQTRNVASRVFKNQMWTTDGRTYDRQKPITKAHLSNQVVASNKICRDAVNYCTTQICISGGDAEDPVIDWSVLENIYSVRCSVSHNVKDTDVELVRR